MPLSKDHIGGLVFLCLSVAYGYYAGEIALLPGDEFAPFNAQSLPSALAVLGGILSIALIVTADRSSAGRLQLAGYDFWLVAKLLLLVVLLGVALPWIGFLASTILFLIGGYWLLGVRSIKTLLLASVPFSVVLWFLLAQLLDIYLAPGRLFTAMLGG
ncbi:tripartite tricarboxylate transporter TctB family protein [Marinobacterium sp. AK62]|uniref:Tripartite tricarboxylate transporter TctB family protein n=1 Tax=Marinobacterium alkalitolerans TaxID=1542925 RepID=A0ABS3Z908_9GAMM|nr:tripartite tricarboxylate transporter TctB family protein [Marinobacterium alkalitolerans]MBP0047489.1 tripartite tricarboxylate transporter TctB family protein [Marinobacterium alkalitolerans]